MSTHTVYLCRSSLVYPRVGGGGSALFVCGCNPRCNSGDRWEGVCVGGATIHLETYIYIHNKSRSIRKASSKKKQKPDAVARKSWRLPSHEEQFASRMVSTCFLRSKQERKQNGSVRIHSAEARLVPRRTWTHLPKASTIWWVKAMAIHSRS